MCGIYGWRSNLVGENGKLNYLKISEMLAHRGPDDSAFFEDSKICLGMVRLSINDQSINGRQPMTKQGVTIVLNGEIYNFKSLRKNLQNQGINFFSNSDTEVVLEMYLKYGEKFVNNLRGMFAIVIYDSRLSKTILARDIFGEKPLYLFRSKSDFFFSSELSPIIRFLGHQLTENSNFMKDYLLFGYSIHGETPFNEVENIKKGYLYILENSTWTELKFDEIKQFHIGENYIDCINELDLILRKSVELQMDTSDSPVAALVSSGLDSTIIAKIALQMNPNLKLFTLGFENNLFDETKDARLKFPEAKHHYIHQLKYSRNLVLDAISKLDVPIADTSIVPMFEITRFASNETKVALTGDGGDELFLGYSTYLASKISWTLENHRFSKNILNKIVNMFESSDSNVGVGYKLNAFVNSMDYESKEFRHLMWRNYFDLDTANELIGNSILIDTPKPLKVKRNTTLRSLQELDLETWLPNNILIKTDRMSMSNSLELRSPFLDSNLRDFSLELPQVFKLKGTKGKRILSDLYKKRYAHTRHGFIKKGFGAPFSSWIRLDHEFYLERIKYTEVFDSSVLSKLFKQHLTKEADNSYKIFALLVYSEWRSKWLKKA